MLKALFTKILNQEKTFSKEEKIIIEKYLSSEILLKKEDHFVMNSKYRIGVLKVDKNFALLQDLQSDLKNIKLDITKLNGAYDQDLVLVKRIFNPRNKFKASIIEVLSKNENDILVYVNDNKLISIKEQILLSHKNIQKVCKAYKNFDVLLLDSKTFDVKKHLGNIKDAKIDETLSLYIYKQIHRANFELEVNVEMKDDEKRKDLTSLAFCTIDPSSAKDHDDAIYYDKDENILYVAIADVSYFVKEGSVIDKAASKKAVSMYLPNKVLPMLPFALSEELCSLVEGVNRYAYVFKIFLDNNYAVTKSEVFEAIIKSQKKFAYEDIDAFLEGKNRSNNECEKNILSYITPLYELTKIIRERRLKKGYDFRTVENRLKLNDKQELEQIITEESTASHQLVEECMLLANIEASKKVANIAIYRIHEEPSFKDISKLIDDVNILGIKAKMGSSVHDTILKIQKLAYDSSIRADVDELIIQAQTQAKYSSKNLGHFGLGFLSYSHFTSPIRRYSDLVLHRMLKTKQVPANIDDICDYISNEERLVDVVVWNLEARKYARWANKNIGRECKAVIVNEDKCLAKLSNDMPGLRVSLDNYKGAKLFSKIKVIIKEVDLVSTKIIASIKY